MVSRREDPRPFSNSVPRTLRLLSIESRAPGAIANGTRVEKCCAVEGDAHGNGAGGIVIGSIGPIHHFSTAVDDQGCVVHVDRMMYGYWVRWDDSPHLTIFITGDRIREVT